MRPKPRAQRGGGGGGGGASATALLYLLLHRRQEAGWLVCSRAEHCPSVPYRIRPDEPGLIARLLGVAREAVNATYGVRLLRIYEESRIIPTYLSIAVSK